jgi:ABC-2 type transport system permease protein
MFAWVTIDIVVWGFITRYLNSMAGSRFDYVPSLLGAVLMGISSPGSCKG